MATYVPDGTYKREAISEELRLMFVASLGERTHNTYAVTVRGGAIVTTHEYKRDEEGGAYLDPDNSDYGLARESISHDPPILLVEPPK